ncbi:hypothetical protein D0812_21905 [Vibrio owensii]|nr:hypothetical protein D0812_21905 [Vibrio owensii]
MSKFENIQVGDTVFIDTAVEISSGLLRQTQGRYFLPAKVIGATPKFFSIESYGGRFHKIRKDNGVEHGGTGKRVKALPFGEVIYGFKEVRTVKDQTEEYLEGIEFSKMFSSVNSMVRIRMDASKVTKQQLQDAFDALSALPKRENI